MSAIYQRARPIRWDQVVGQEHVRDVLQAALERGKLGHAYLFSGPRGVGKTTTARLIAMTANCEGPDPKPCGECTSCLEVRAGSHPDVREIDAASHNSVDDVRELRENLNLASMRGGKKIYILDEAHMMSRAAFNALLKTLEEPPGHVIFVLATTEPEKILPTILSRCQHYRFRRLSEAEIAGKLAALCAQEGVAAEESALNLIGRLADGAMRDGESLLERMLSTGEAITRGSVEAALGLPPSERMADMARALALPDAEGLLAGAAQLYREGYAARTVVGGLLGALRDALHAELGLGEGERLEGAGVPRLLRLQAALDEQEARFARGADLLNLELALTHALLAGEVAGAGAMTASASSPPTDVNLRLSKIERELSALKSVPRPAAKAEVPDFDPGARGSRATPAPAKEAAPQAAEGAPSVPQGSWTDVLRLADIKMRALLKVARANPIEGALIVTYDERHKFHAKQVQDKFEELAGLVERVYGPIELELVTSEGSKKKSGRRAEPAAMAQVVEQAARQVEVRTVAEPERPAAPPITPPESKTGPAEFAAVPDFSPQRPTPIKPTPTESAPPKAEVAKVEVTPAAIPTPQPSVYDPEPIFQEPVWDDVPPTSPAPLPEASWDDLSAAPRAEKTVQAEPSRPAPRAVRGALKSAPAVAAHPLFAEAQRLFPGKVQAAGVVRRKAGAGADEEEGAEEGPSEAGA